MNRIVASLLAVALVVGCKALEPAVSSSPPATTTTSSAAAPVAPAISGRPGKAGIASAHALATEAGFEVLAKGGNAFDAAIAIGAALAVVEPQSSGIGGGAFFLLRRASDGKQVFLDARETAPAASRSELWADAEGKIDRDKSVNGPMSAGIPGEPAAYAYLAKHYGKLALGDSLAPAIRIAREGFPLYPRLFKAIGQRKPVLTRWPASAKLYLVDGEAPAAGSTWRNPDLAATLERIAKDGDEGFYKGEFASKLVDAVRAAGGIWTLEDLAAYKVKEREPIVVDYRGWRIVTAPPPSSGGIALAEMFNILAGYDLSKRDRVHRVHLTIEAMRRAYRDRAEYLGDPDYVQMPIAELTSPLYAAGLRASIHPDKATPSDSLPGYMPPTEAEHTTHYSIIDADGNMAAVTKTVNLTLGSGFVVDGTGFVLNNEMDDFALLPGQPNAFGLVGGEANAPKAGRRPLSSMTPSFVIGADRVGVIGTPGGSRIITMVLEGILAYIDGDTPATVVANGAPPPVSARCWFGRTGRVHARGSQGAGRPGTVVNQGERTWGLMNMVGWDRRSNELSAGSDPREEMSSAGVR